MLVVILCVSPRAEGVGDLATSKVLFGRRQGRRVPGPGGEVVNVMADSLRGRIALLHCTCVKLTATKAYEE